MFDTVSPSSSPDNKRRERLVQFSGSTKSEKEGDEVMSEYLDMGPFERLRLIVSNEEYLEMKSMID